MAFLGEKRVRPPAVLQEQKSPMPQWLCVDVTANHHQQLCRVRARKRDEEAVCSALAFHARFHRERQIVSIGGKPASATKHHAINATAGLWTSELERRAIFLVKQQAPRMRSRRLRWDDRMLRYCCTSVYRLCTSSLKLYYGMRHVGCIDVTAGIDFSDGRNGRKVHAYLRVIRSRLSQEGPAIGPESEDPFSDGVLLASKEKSPMKTSLVRAFDGRPQSKKTKNLNHHGGRRRAYAK